MKWLFVLGCIVSAAMFPDLPLLAGRMWGYKSDLPAVISGGMLLASMLYLLVYVLTDALDDERWLSSAFAATSLIGIGSGLLALGALTGVVSSNFYNVFRGFPSHLLQFVTVVFLLLHVFENTKSNRVTG
jgi:hypothetical protein